MNVIARGPMPATAVFQRAPLQPAGQTEPSLPKDLVELGSRPAEKPATPPASQPAVKKASSPAQAPPITLIEETPAAPAHDERREAEQLAVTLRGMYREVNAPVVTTLSRQLENGELKGEDFQQAATTLHELAHQTADPLVARMARSPLYDKFKWKESHLDFVMKMGPIEGPLHALKGRLGTITGYSRDRYYLTDETVTPFLGSLYEATDNTPAPAEAVATVARLAHEFFQRATQELSEGVREHESPEQDRAWAETCASVLDGWWSMGDLKIVEGGREIARGEVDLAALLKQRSPTLRGTTIDLTEIPKPEAAAARDVAKRIPTWEKDAAPGIGELDALAVTDADRAARVISEFVDLALHGDDHDDIRRVARILEEGAPATCELFRAHLPRMTRLASELETRGPLVDNNLDGHAKARYYTTLIQRFPEVVDERLLAEELEPLYHAEINTANDLRPLFSDLWDARPELMAGSLARSIARPTPFYVDSETTRLIDKAIEKGWEPSPLQTDWLVSWLYQPCGNKEDDSLTRNQTFAWAAKAVRTLADRSPGLLNGVRLPDTQGKLRPGPEALVDRVLHDPNADAVRPFFAGGSGHGQTGRGIEDLYALAFPNEEITENLLEIAEAGYRRTGDCNKMAREEQRALTILGSVDLPESAHKRLRELLAGERYRDQGWYVFNDIVDHYRQEFQAEALEVVTAPESSVEQRLGATREYLRMGMGRLSDWDLSRYCKRVTEPLREAMTSHHPEATESTFRSLLSSGMEEANRANDLAEMKLEGLADLVLARDLAEASPDRQVAFKETIRPLLSKPIDYQPAVRKFFEPLRDQQIQAHQEALKTDAVDHSRRAAMVAENVAMAERTYDLERHTEETLAAWHEGLQDGWTGRLASRYQESARAFEAYQAIVTDATADQLEARFERFGDLLARLGGEPHHADAVTAFGRMNAALERGGTLEQARETALRGYLADPGETPEVGGIEVEETRVKVSGISLPKRKLE